jgi:hypothetical protein
MSTQAVSEPRLDEAPMLTNKRRSLDLTEAPTYF